MSTPRQPGWYDDLRDSHAQRYWDGQDWTPHRKRNPLSRQTQASVTLTLPNLTFVHFSRACVCGAPHVGGGLSCTFFGGAPWRLAS
jgi:hypothetical protein